MLLVVGTFKVTIQDSVNMILMCVESRLQGRPVDLGIASVEPNVVCSTRFVCLTELFLQAQIHAPVTYLVLEFVPELLLDSLGADGTTRALVKVLGRLFEIEVAHTRHG